MSQSCVTQKRAEAPDVPFRLGVRALAVSFALISIVSLSTRSHGSEVDSMPDVAEQSRNPELHAFLKVYQSCYGEVLGPEVWIRVVQLVGSDAIALYPENDNDFHKRVFGMDRAAYQQLLQSNWQDIVRELEEKIQREGVEKHPYRDRVFELGLLSSRLSGRETKVCSYFASIEEDLARAELYSPRVTEEQVIYGCIPGEADAASIFATHLNMGVDDLAGWVKGEICSEDKDGIKRLKIVIYPGTGCNMELTIGGTGLATAWNHVADVYLLPHNFYSSKELGAILAAIGLGTEQAEGPGLEPMVGVLEPGTCEVLGSYPVTEELWMQLQRQIISFETAQSEGLGEGQQ